MIGLLFNFENFDQRSQYVHEHQISPIINILKMLGCATNQDSLLLATLRYVNYHSGLINKNYSLDLSSIDCSEMKENYKLQFDDHFRAFVGNSMIISCKTEIQMVILRCSTGLTLDCIKSYDSKCKYFHFCFFVIL